MYTPFENSTTRTAIMINKPKATSPKEAQRTTFKEKFTKYMAKVCVRVRILANCTRTNAHVRVRVRFEFWQNAHVRAMCVRPKIECANVRACEAKNRRNSQIDYSSIIYIGN